MKKTLIALAALAATGAFAQVSVYGRLDAGYGMYTKTAPIAATSTTMQDTKSNGVQSKNSVSSMMGFKGSEDLGGGLKANFILEGNLDPASGGASPTTAGFGFDRTSLIGLSGAFGSLSFGRDYVPTFKLVSATDVNALSNISTIQNTGVASTVPNLVFYSSPVMSGFQVNVAYGNTDTSAASETSQKTTNVSATYTNGPLFVGVGTGSYEVKTAGAAGGTFVVGAATFTGVDKTSSTTLAAGYNFGVFALKGNMVSTKATIGVASALGAVGDEIKSDELNIGGTMPLGKVTLVAQVGTNKISATGMTENYTGTDMVIGADYALSAKTALYAKTGTVGKLSGNGQEYKTTATAVGIKTVF